MATTGSTGGVTTQGSRTYFFGTSSGLNTSALVEAAYNQRIAPATKIDTQISKNGNKIDAYTTLSTLSKAVKSSLANLSSSFGFSNANPTYAFNARSGLLSTNNTTDPTKLAGVTIDPGTALGSYQLEVIQKATANRIASDTSADPAVALGATGSFNIGLAGGATSTINVTSGQSLNDLAATINASTATSGVAASIIKTNTNSYQLVLTGNATAKAISVTGITGSNVLQNIGVLNGSNTAKNTLQTAKQAQLKLDGVPITRDTNDVSDLISGVHISVLNAEPGTLISLNVTNDTTQLKANIESFVTAYNSYRDFIVTNQTVANGLISNDAVLFGDTILKSLNDSLQPLISQSYSNGSNTLTTLAELGLKFDPTNHLTVDESKLDDAILNHYDDIKSIFTSTATSNNTSFALIGNTSKQKNMAFTMTIYGDGTNVTGVTVGGNPSLFDFSGTSITGKKGTIYEGLNFAYTAGTNTTINFTLTQGAGNLISNTISNYTDAVTGSIAAQQTTLSSQTTDLTSRADDIRARADDFRTKLIDKYARFEASIARSKSVIAQLQAILGINKNN